LLQSLRDETMSRLRATTIALQARANGYGDTGDAGFSFPAELNDFKLRFAAFDSGGSGAIDVHELVAVLTNLGEPTSAGQLKALIREADASNDGNGMVTFGTFLRVLESVRAARGAGGSGPASAVNTSHSLGYSDSVHAYSDEEKVAFTKHINHWLHDDADCLSRLPLTPESLDLFQALQDGVVLCKLINLARPGTIDERALNR
jgi:hypothetical protein